MQKLLLLIGITCQMHGSPTCWALLFSARFFGIQHAHNFQLTVCSWTVLCALSSEMSWLSGDVSELNASVLSAQAICMTHIAFCCWCTWASGYLLLSRALHHTTSVSLTLHVLCTPPPTMNECQLMWQCSLAEIRSYCILQHLTMFQYVCHLSKLPVHR